MALRSYAMCGTEPVMRGTEEENGATSLRACYAMRSTETAYGAISAHELALRCAVLRSYMLLPGHRLLFRCCAGSAGRFSGW
eukprot:2984210-Rhodomonas_salina.3